MVKSDEKSKWADFLLWVNILLRFSPVYYKHTVLTKYCPLGRFVDQLAKKWWRLKIWVYIVIFLRQFCTLWKKSLRNRCIIDWVTQLRNVKFVVEAAPLLHFFLTVLHFYTRNACSFTRVDRAVMRFISTWLRHVFWYKAHMVGQDGRHYTFIPYLRPRMRCYIIQ